MNPKPSWNFYFYSSEFEDLLNKCIACIYNSDDHQSWLIRKKVLNRLGRRDADSFGWRMENKYEKIMDKIDREGTTIDRLKEQNSAYKKRRNKVRKLAMLGVLLFVVSQAKADIGDQITASLIDHVAAHSQWTTKGENRLALLASIVQIGKMDGSSIAQIRFGYNTTVNDSSQTDGYVGDVYMNISPFVRKYVKLDPNWTFLNSIEMGPNYAYDFQQHHSYLAFSVGLAFGLNPKA